MPDEGERKTRKSREGEQQKDLLKLQLADWGGGQTPRPSDRQPSSGPSSALDTTANHQPSTRQMGSLCWWDVVL